MATRKIVSISEAVHAVADHVRQTNQPISEAIQHVWPRLGQFSAESVRELMQEALALRTSPLLTRRQLPVDVERTVKGTAITIRPYRQTLTKVEVSIKILDDVIYHVGGKAKPISAFTINDVEAKLDLTTRVREGIERHEQIWSEALDLLQSEGKTIVSELSIEGQQAIAEKVVDARVARENLPAAIT